VEVGSTSLLLPHLRWHWGAVKAFTYSLDSWKERQGPEVGKHDALSERMLLDVTHRGRT
jgi:hypothetical protein